jgi:hypothetical protein
MAQDTRHILHVKGTESGTTELPKSAIRAAISQGQLTHSQLIWVPSENTWRQVREMPHLLPSQQLAPAPPTRMAPPRSIPQVDVTMAPDSPSNAVARAASASVPKVRVADTSSTPVPKVRVAVVVPTVVPAEPAQQVAEAAVGVPTVRVASAVPVAAPQVHASSVPVAVPAVRVAAAAPVATPAVKVANPVRVQSSKNMIVAEEDSSHPLKWLCIGLGLLVAVVIAGNFFLVDQPLRSRLASTPYSNVTAHAHLGAFMQPNVVVIHIPASTAITAENITDFLSALSRSTPHSPFSGTIFDRIALTSGWTAQYTLLGEKWKQLGSMTESNADERKDFLLAQLGDASGNSLVPASTMNTEAREEQREKIWNDFVAHFAKP